MSVVRATEREARATKATEQKRGPRDNNKYVLFQDFPPSDVRENTQWEETEHEFGTSFLRFRNNNRERERVSNALFSIASSLFHYTGILSIYI